MRAILREIKKHFLIYLLFVKNSLMAQMEYRFNFIGNLAMESGYLLVKLSYVVVVYRSGVKINGLSPDEILLFIGTFVTLTAVYAGLFMINNFRLRAKIKDGDLDLLLTKPVSLQFMATLRQADLTIFSVDLIAGGIMVAIAWSRLGIPVTLYTRGRIPGIPCYQLPGQLQPVPAAADPLLLADEHQRHRRDHRLVLGFQQHADGYLQPLDQAGRGVPFADLRDHQLPAHVRVEQDAAGLPGLVGGAAAHSIIRSAEIVEQGPAPIQQREQLSALDDNRRVNRRLLFKLPQNPFKQPVLMRVDARREGLPAGGLPAPVEDFLSAQYFAGESIPHLYRATASHDAYIRCLVQE